MVYTRKCETGDSVRGMRIGQSLATATVVLINFPLRRHTATGRAAQVDLPCKDTLSLLWAYGTVSNGNPSRHDQRGAWEYPLFNWPACVVGAAPVIWFGPRGELLTDGQCTAVIAMRVCCCCCQGVRIGQQCLERQVGVQPRRDRDDLYHYGHGHVARVGRHGRLHVGYAGVDDQCRTPPRGASDLPLAHHRAVAVAALGRMADSDFYVGFPSIDPSAIDRVRAWVAPSPPASQAR